MNVFLNTNLTNETNSAQTLCLFDSVSLCLFVPLSLCPFDFLTLCLFLSLTLCLFVSLSLCLKVSRSQATHGDNVDAVGTLVGILSDGNDDCQKRRGGHAVGVNALCQCGQIGGTFVDVLFSSQFDL